MPLDPFAYFRSTESRRELALALVPPIAFFDDYMAGARQATKMRLATKGV
jgi:hypothetical protein